MPRKRREELSPTSLEKLRAKDRERKAEKRAQAKREKELAEEEAREAETEIDRQEEQIAELLNRNRQAGKKFRTTKKKLLEMIGYSSNVSTEMAGDMKIEEVVEEVKKHYAEMEQTRAQERGAIRAAYKMTKKKNASNGGRKRQFA